MRTLVVGLGNPILGDDGVGWAIADVVRERLNTQPSNGNQIEVECLSLGGLSLMERLIGYDNAILIDAIELGLGKPGSIYQFKLDELPNPAAGHTGSAHDTTLASAMEMGRTLGATLPEQVFVIAIEAKIVFEFCESLTAAVAAAIPQAAQLVLATVDQLAEI